jgi:hypothetical protein
MLRVRSASRDIVHAHHRHRLSARCDASRQRARLDGGAKIAPVRLHERSDLSKILSENAEYYSQFLE